MRTLLFASLAAVLAAACGPKSGPSAVVNPETPPTPTGQPVPQDQAFEYPELPVTALYYQPEALSYPSMEFKVSGKRTVADQRKRYKSAKGDDKFVEGDALAVLLWAQGTDAAKGEARDLYRELVKTGKAPEGTLSRAAAVEVLGGEEPRAGAAYDEIVTRFATSPNAAVNRAYKAYFQLRKGDDAGAAATMADVVKGDGDPAEVSYVAAWLAFRKGDAAKAFTLVTAAVDKWTLVAGLPALRRDVMIFGSRGDAEPAAVVGVLASASKRDNAELPGLIATLGDAYKFAGRYDRRVQTYEVLVPKAAPAAIAEIRYQEADAEYRMNRPDKAADRAIEAWEASLASKDAKGEVREALAKFLLTLGTVDHATFQQTGDRRYGDAAKRLYTAYLKIEGRADHNDAQSRATQLDASLSASPDALPGIYDQQMTLQRIRARLEEIGACYEGVLQGAPALAGTVKVTFDLTQDGTVSAVSPDPAAGNDGLGAVSRCLVDRLGKWSFPSRTRPGLTRIVLPIAYARAQQP